MPEPEQQPAEWRSALDGYLRPPPAHLEAAPTALGLQVELRELLPRTTYRWNGPTSQAVTPRRRRDAVPGSGEYRLGARPVTRTQRGWARGGLTWSNLPHKQRQLGLDPDQHRWFTQLGAMHRAGAPVAPGQDPDWLFLDEFQNPVLWRLLEQGERLGVPLVGSAGTVVRVAGPAALTFDVARDGDALRAGPLLTLGGEPVAVRRAQAIGTSGLYLFDPAEPREVVLAELDVPLDPERQRLLHALGGEPVVVPPTGVEEFLRDYVPQLRDRVEVTSRDASVALPAVAPPRLVLTAAFGAGHRLALSWAWETRRDAVPPPLTEVVPPGLLPESLQADDDGVPPAAVLTELDAAEFAARVLPRLEALGVRVETTGVRPDYRELTGAPRLVVRAVPGEKADWFDLGVEVLLDGRRIPFTPLFKALAAGRRRILLADGAYLSLHHPAFAPLADLIADAGDLEEWRAGPRLSRYQTALWSEFEDLADEADPAVDWRALLTEVRGAPEPVPAPDGLEAELRPYQADGLAWLSFLWRHRLGGVLADDMGLGKTLQCLALMLAVRQEGTGPFLVVAPTSVVSNWAAEAARFTPGLVVRTVTATEAKLGTPLAELARGADVVVTSYALLRLDAEAYRGVAHGDGWAGLILDEAQFVKNAASRIHEVVRDLPVRFKLAVTGTPMENSLTELHAILGVVAPGLFASARRFREEYVRPIEEVRTGIQAGAGAGEAPEVAARLRADRLARLRRRIRPFLLRRTKETVAAELPAKQEQVLTVDLAPDHRALYDLWLQRERRKLMGLLPDMDRNRFIVFRSLTLLRLLALDPALIGEEATGSKLDALLEQLDDVLAEGHRALVFSQFTSYLARVQQRLTEAGIATAYLDGGTRDRDAAIAAFKHGEAPVFLISLKAGGFGLNLTEADYVFLLDPWWNPASEEQAIDRTHRIGQDKQVMVYRLVAAGTIEEKVMALKQRKAAVFDAVIDDEALFGSLLNADDVRELLG